MAVRRVIATTTVDDDPDLNRLGAQIGSQFVWRSNRMRPLHERMDYDMAMYLLLDTVQNRKPAGFFRFISNDPQTGVDSAHSILTRNDVYWDIDSMQLPDAQLEEREKIEKVEMALGGIVNDYDKLFLNRGEGTFWHTAAYQALLRGFIWGKFIVTDESGRDDGVPIQGEFWDPRMVFPVHDGAGLHSVIVAKEITLAELIGTYPDNERLRTLTKGQDEYDLDLSASAYKLEWWDFRNKGMTGVLATWPGNASEHSFSVPWGKSQFFMQGTWVQEPFHHGYDEDNRPVFGVPVNPLSGIKVLPSTDTSSHDNRTPNQAPLRGVKSWYGPGGSIAQSGRSILAAVEEHVPQFNELMATVLHRFAMDAYGSFTVKTRSGSMPELELGVGAVNALRLEESIDHLQVQPVNSDAYRIMGILQDEKQRGVISNILQAADSTGSQSGFAVAQTVDIARNSLSPYDQGLKNFGTRFAQSMLAQMRDAKPGVIELVTTSRAQDMIAVDFDPATDLGERQYKPVPRFEPALPADLALRAQTARLLLDPRNPVMSLETVLQRVFRHPDAQGEIRKIWKGIANTDPIVVLMQMVQALREDGQDELADLMETNLFRSKFVQDAQFRQIQNQLGTPGVLPGGEDPGPSGGLGPEGGGSSAPARAQQGLPPEASGVDNAPSQTGAQA